MPSRQKAGGSLLLSLGFALRAQGSIAQLWTTWRNTRLPASVQRPGDPGFRRAWRRCFPKAPPRGGALFANQLMGQMSGRHAEQRKAEIHALQAFLGF